MRVFALIPFVFLVGCYRTSPTYTYNISDSFTGGERASIRRGFVTWEQASEGVVRFIEDSRDGQIRVLPVTEKDSRVQRLHGNHGALLAGALDSEILILTERVDPRKYEVVVAHELGHLLGLSHLSPGNIMSEYIQGTSTRPTCQDVQALCSVFSCKAKDLLVCRR